MTNRNDLVRSKLVKVNQQGLMLKAIAINIGVDVNDLSRFKGGMDCLKQSDVEMLFEYLNAVVIPQRAIIEKTEIKPNKKRKQVSLDLLRELD